MVTLIECGVCMRDKCKSLFAETPSIAHAVNHRKKYNTFEATKLTFLVFTHVFLQ